MSSDETSYFLNIAVIGGTLLALSFVTLQFFLGELLKRFEATALPVFRSRDSDEVTEPCDSLTPPDSLKDVRLFDGDPLVIFMAFSVAVTWIQFLVPLTLGLTAAWLGTHLMILAVELACLLVAFGFSFVTRNKAIKRLRPYLTRDELLWPVLGGILLALYIVAAGVALISALPAPMSTAPYLAIWNRWGISNDYASLFVLKVVCIVSLLVGTYTTNKDMFIFFKSVASERMRQRWLESFLQERYLELKRRVEVASSKAGVNARLADLEQEWNKGCPETISTHDALNEAGPASVIKVWQNLINGRSGTPSWMLDVPRIANWEARVEKSLKRAMTPLSTPVENSPFRRSKIPQPPPGGG